MCARPLFIKSLIKNVIDDTEQHVTRPEQVVLDEWTALVDTDVAGNTKVIRLERGVLLVLTPSPVWAQELRARYYKKIMGAIQKRFGKNVVKKILFKVGVM